MFGEEGNGSGTNDLVKDVLVLYIYTQSHFVVNVDLYDFTLYIYISLCTLLCFYLYGPAFKWSSDHDFMHLPLSIYIQILMRAYIHLYIVYVTQC